MSTFVPGPQQLARIRDLRAEIAWAYKSWHSLTEELAAFEAAIRKEDKPQ